MRAVLPNLVHLFAQQPGIVYQYYAHETGERGDGVNVQYVQAPQPLKYLYLSGATNRVWVANHPLSTFSLVVVCATLPVLAPEPLPTLAYQAVQVAANHLHPASQDIPKSHPTSFHLHVYMLDE